MNRQKSAGPWDKGERGRERKKKKYIQYSYRNRFFNLWENANVPIYLYQCIEHDNEMTDSFSK